MTASATEIDIKSNAVVYNTANAGENDDRAGFLLPLSEATTSEAEQQKRSRAVESKNHTRVCTIYTYTVSSVFIVCTVSMVRTLSLVCKVCNM